MNWDTYFYNLCNAVSKNSKCLSRNLGAVITRDKYIISTGYNGPPSGGSHCSDPKYREWLFHKANAEGIAPLSMKWNSTESTVDFNIIIIETTFAGTDHSLSRSSLSTN